MGEKSVAVWRFIGDSLADVSRSALTSIWFVIALAVTVPTRADSDLQKTAERLGQGSFSEREEAQLELWSAGQRARGLLENLSSSENPETAFRAREVLRSITFGLTPETSPEVLEMVEEYESSTLEEKQAIFQRLRNLSAGLQALYLLKSDQSAHRGRLLQALEGIELGTARQAILSGDAAKVPEILGLAPRAAAGRRALAAFYNATGQIKAERRKAAWENDVKGKEWELILAREAGDLKAVTRLAKDLGREDVLAVVAFLRGDPVPLMEHYQALEIGDGELVFKDELKEAHFAISIADWQGKPTVDSALEILEEASKVGEVDNQRLAVRSLAASGYRDAAEELQSLVSETQLANYFEANGHLDRAFEILKFSNTKAEREELARIYLEAYVANPDQVSVPEEVRRAANIAGALSTYGEHAAAREILDPLSAAVKADSRINWIRLISPYYGATSYSRSLFQGVTVELFKAYAEEDIEQQGEISNDLIAVVFRDRDVMGRTSVTNALKEKFGLEAFEKLGVLSGLFPDRLGELDELEDYLLEALPDDEVRLLLARLAQSRGQDLESLLTLTKDLESPVFNSEGYQLALHLFRQEWKEALPLAKKSYDEARSNVLRGVQYELVLRKLGKAKKARSIRQEVQAQLLGEPRLVQAVATQWSQLGEDQRATDELKELLLTLDPTDSRFLEILTGTSRVDRGLAEWALLSRDWKIAGPAFQLLAFLAVDDDFGTDELRSNLDTAGKLKLSRGMAALEAGDVLSALPLLKSAQEAFRGIGVLSDEYFPLIYGRVPDAFYNERFEKSYAEATESLKNFPESDDQHNSAAWLASRAVRRLPEALEHINKALSLRPNHSAYLDTKGEVFFAMGEREKALEWSRKALSYAAGEAMMWRQFRHFRDDQLPNK